MHDLLRVGIIGDFDPQLRSHIATNEAISHAASALSVTVECAWLPTPSLDGADHETLLQPCDALWCAPASPYKSMQGALRAIRFAREKGWPFLGTWGGFQHTLVEYARHVLAIADAEHAETAPEASCLVISPLTCSLVGTAQTIKLLPGTLTYRAYEQDEVTEQFMCHYGLNPAYRDRISTGGLKVVGLDAMGDVRVVEISAHRFFIATLFLPQLSSGPDMPHPLIVAYLREAQAFRAFQQGNDGTIQASGIAWHTEQVVQSQRAANAELTVFIANRVSTCGECGEPLGAKVWITLAREKGALCLACADLEHLLFLPAGDGALTRRARQHSTLSAVVLQWSRARKRYERQGLFVEAQALAHAEEACLADSEVRPRRQEREAIRKAAGDRQYVDQFAARVRALFG